MRCQQRKNGTEGKNLLRMTASHWPKPKHFRQLPTIIISSFRTHTHTVYTTNTESPPPPALRPGVFTTFLRRPHLPVACFARWCRILRCGVVWCAAVKLAAGMLGDLFSPGDFGGPDGGGGAGEGGAKPGITLPEFRPTGEGGDTDGVVSYHACKRLRRAPSLHQRGPIVISVRSQFVCTRTPWTGSINSGSSNFPTGNARSYDKHSQRQRRYPQQPPPAPPAPVAPYKTV